MYMFMYIYIYIYIYDISGLGASVAGKTAHLAGPRRLGPHRAPLGAAERRRRRHPGGAGVSGMCIYIQSYHHIIVRTYVYIYIYMYMYTYIYIYT